jgi:hypothetical protein
MVPAPGGPMARKRKQSYHCSVVDETVQIHLCKKPSAGLRSKSEFFVQCDQDECQYVDKNEPPCPLNLSMFEEEIQEREERARRLREESEHHY